MIDIFESRYPEWKREQVRKHVRKELKQWPAIMNRDPYCIANDYDWPDRDEHSREELKQWPAIIALIAMGCVLAFGMGML